MYHTHTVFVKMPPSRTPPSGPGRAGPYGRTAPRPSHNILVVLIWSGASGFWVLVGCHCFVDLDVEDLDPVVREYPELLFSFHGGIVSGIDGVLRWV